jgi:hypothetical protein
MSTDLVVIGYQRESYVFLLISSLQFIFSVIILIGMKYFTWQSVSVPVLDHIGAFHCFFTSILLIIISLDPSGVLHLLQPLIIEVLGLAITGVLLSFLIFVFDGTMRVVLGAHGLLDKFPSRKVTCFVPIFMYFVVTATSLCALLLTRRFKYATGIGFYSALLILLGSFSTFRTSKIMQRNESETLMMMSQQDTKEINGNSIRIKLLASSIGMLSVAAVVLVVTAQRIFQDQVLMDAVPIPNEYSLTTTMIPWLSVVGMMEGILFVTLWNLRKTALLEKALINQAEVPENSGDNGSRRKRVLMQSTANEVSGSSSYDLYQTRSNLGSKE